VKRLLIAVALIAALAVPAAAAADTSHVTEVVVPRGQPVQIAFADDLTGAASVFGASIAKAVQIAVEAQPAIRGFPIQINLVDAPCNDPTADVAAATSIVANSQNVAVLGQLCSSGFDQVLPLYQSADLVTITGSATDPVLPSFGPTVFDRTAVNDACCPFVDQFDPWYATVGQLPSDLAWQQAYSAEFGTVPTAFADLYYDAAGLLIRDLKNVSSIDGSGNLVVDRTGLAQAVRGTTKYRGVSCTITLDAATGNRLDDPTELSRCASDAD
jgi:ABC-type branched-subunit amino acid transport system substrate-binding protein